jgi:hypothetical protein
MLVQSAFKTAANTILANAIVGGSEPQLTRTYQMAVGPEQAAELLRVYPYDKQRPFKRATVLYYADLMRRGEFIAGSDIDIAFGSDEDGERRGHLLNGRHRLLAIIESGQTIVFLIKEWATADATERAKIYGSIDNGYGRNTGDYARALGLEDELGICLSDTTHLAGAVGFMQNGFKKLGKYSVTPDQRMDAIREYGEIGKSYFRAIEGASKILGHTLRRIASISVGLATLQDATKVYGEAKVIEFWRGVALDDGLKVGDPRKVVVRHLTESSMKVSNTSAYKTPEYSARYIANCFNAWARGEKLTKTYVADPLCPMSLLGTRHKGK